jgi:hypothetical protein
MLLTEEEAWKRICPSREWATTCEASRCMAWRWYESVNKGNNIPQNKPKTIGFCGLAGKP